MLKPLLTDLLQGITLDPGLYIVPTPIGNTFDITLRGLRTLALVDFILCEDTRKTALLLNEYGIQKKLFSFHDHNEKAKLSTVMNKLKQGATVALVSDAGTPLVSDPGFPLIREAVKENLKIYSLPGPSSIMCALVASGLAVNRFAFIGFLKSKSAARKKELSPYKNRQETLIFFEAAHRLNETLQDIYDVLGSGKIVIARELTKTYEEFIRGELVDILQHLQKEASLRGEIVVLFEAHEQKVDRAEIQNKLAEYLAVHPLRTAVDLASAQLGVSRKDVYQLALQLKDGKTK
ncbi:MAG: 16S rRNA (cytidine(1402)-2'-O)-methyltransferase [Alphaproteobacteria bacterium]|nr:16S rRNA (cytidine(1402)-2'-O)-methyltransferase [Alphaproteobacteria bacterium]OJV47528.1 MAG: 16S rRNA (cytidine(1402)-2'-O)-methyltransferase [Alphaproteobacteria bacterium 43-37]